MNAEVNKVVRSLKRTVKKPKKKKKEQGLLIPTGSTMLNLECSGDYKGAFQCGKLVNIIGDSSSGKSLLALSTLAECASTPEFDNYHFIYDDVEAANEFDIPTLFGNKIAVRIELTNRSRTIEAFNDTIAQLLEVKEPFIYILDSFDALTSEAFIAKDMDNRKSREKGNKISGSYGDGKAKIFSDFCKNRIQDLKDTGSALIILSQTRDNLGFGAQFTPKTRAGGRALRFYACHELWTSTKKQIKKNKRITTTDVCVKISKNKLNGNRGEAYFPILRDYGIDDVTSCIEFLVNEGPWSGPANSINTKGFVTEKISKTKLVTHIENKNRELELKQLCQAAYLDVMEQLKPQRKYKYKEK
jgi:RecA/RadA recombinase